MLFALTTDPAAALQFVQTPTQRRSVEPKKLHPGLIAAIVLVHVLLAWSARDLLLPHLPQRRAEALRVEFIVAERPAPASPRAPAATDPKRADERIVPPARRAEPIAAPIATAAVSSHPPPRWFNDLGQPLLAEPSVDQPDFHRPEVASISRRPAAPLPGSDQAIVDIGRLRDRPTPMQWVLRQRVLSVAEHLAETRGPPSFHQTFGSSRPDDCGLVEARLRSEQDPLVRGYDLDKHDRWCRGRN